MLRLARVIARGEEAFEGREATLDWLNQPNAALGGGTPYVSAGKGYRHRERHG
ncbi:MAG: DUF2384 domain-containing protein [Chromatiaceae bacterium]|nr:DUF2384 domain-containing protein [Chromatiaceae bacterium]